MRWNRMRGELNWNGKWIWTIYSKPLKRIRTVKRISFFDPWFFSSSRSSFFLCKLYWIAHSQDPNEIYSFTSKFFVFTSFKNFPTFSLVYFLIEELCWLHRKYGSGSDRSHSFRSLISNTKTIWNYREKEKVNWWGRNLNKNETLEQQNNPLIYSFMKNWKFIKLIHDFDLDDDVDVVPIKNVSNGNNQETMNQIEYRFDF